jgi:hypothetical protein
MLQAKAPNSLPAVVVQDPSDSDHNVSPQEQAMKDANHYRTEASRHYQLRKECFHNAQNALKKGLTAVASYYSQVVSGRQHNVKCKCCCYGLVYL